MSTAKGISIAGSYWIGIAMTLLCFALILAGNTELGWRFEHRGFPLSWLFASAAVVAFLVCEFCQSARSRPRPRDAEERASQLTPVWESAESISE